MELPENADIASPTSDKPQEEDEECTPDMLDTECSPHTASPDNTLDTECSPRIAVGKGARWKSICREHSYAYPACTETARKKHSSLGMRLHNVRKSLRAANAQNVELKKTCRRLKKAIDEYCRAESDAPAEYAARQMLAE